MSLLYSTLFPAFSAAAHVLSIDIKADCSSRVGNHTRLGNIGAGRVPAGRGCQRILKQTAAISPSKKNEAQEIDRPLANFHPTVWGGFFTHLLASENQIDHAQVQQRVETLKEQVRMMLNSTSKYSDTAHDDGCRVLEEEMKLVDVLQRLGLAYHFEEEINDALAHIHASQYSTVLAVSEEDLRVVSLRFRLLRWGGYNVSSDVFNKFKDVHGHFKGSLISSDDIEGLLSLYEASYLGTLQEEDGILEEAMSFCRTELESVLDRLQPPLAAEVVRTLDIPLVRRVKRLEAREYLSIYEATEGRNDVILELAKLDFNRVQSLHQHEIRDLTRWWKELGLIEKLSFARDRLVECYFWMLGVKYEPHLAHARMMMTKVMCLASVLDDIYDSYGTLEELQLLTDVIQRWDIDEVEGLIMPDYLKTYFMALSDLIKGFEQKSYRVQYIKEGFKAQSKVYLKEAEWCNQGHTPTFQEHLQVSMASSGVGLLTCGFFVFMGGEDDTTFDWLLASKLKIVEASSMIGRLIGDVAAHEFEEERKHVASTVRCYMKEHDGVSKETTYLKFREMADTAWKVMNEEWIEPTDDQIPRQLRAVPFELARLVEMYYIKGREGYTHSSGETKDIINLLLVERLPL